MEKTAYAPGTPSWIDLGADIDKAKAFYGSLFGWEAAETGTIEETGGYCIFMLQGKPVAGLGPQQGPGHPYWTTYISVADADATAAKVKDAGGSVVVEPMDVMDAGRMAVFSDSTGAMFSVWQPGTMPGAGLVNESNTWCWSELDSRDVEGAKAFYTKVFGWKTEDMEGPMQYTTLKVGDDPIGGLMPMPEAVPAMVPSFWLTYFAVDDCDAAIKKVESLGGSVLMPPMDIPGTGRFSVVTDDQGATFAVITMEPMG